jgi:hypothetical protein
MCCEVWQPGRWELIMSLMLMLTPTKLSILVADFLFHESSDIINICRNRPELLDYVL